MTDQQTKSLTLTYDEFRVLARVLLKESEFHLAQLPGALEVDAFTDLPTLHYLDSMLVKLGYGTAYQVKEVQA